MTDKDLIAALGGPTKVAQLLGFDKKQGGVQRVQNWLSRGIPAQVKLDFPHIFLAPKRAAPVAVTTAARAEAQKA